MGDVLEDVREHLTDRQWRAGLLFLRELQKHHGQSAGLVSSISEKIDLSHKARLRPPGGPSIAALDARMHRLRPHERTLMAYLIKQRELVRGGLADFGRQHSGYAQVKTQRAYVTGLIAAMLSTLADEYFGPQEA